MILEPSNQGRTAGERHQRQMAPLDLGWKARAQAELALMEECAPYLTKRAEGAVEA